MITLFTILNKNEFEYWQDNIHDFTTYFYKDDINDTIKILLQYYSNVHPVGFYNIHIKAEEEFEKLKWLEASLLYMYKTRQVTLFFLLNKPVNEFALHNLCRKIDNLEISREIVFEQFNVLLSKDKIANLQKHVEDTQDIMAENITMLLDRGEKLDQLIDKSNQLTTQSKLFSKKARQLHSCCTIL